MKTNKVQMFTALNVDEMKSVIGGYIPPSDEQMKRLREVYGPLADIICW